ncbi:MAG: PTS fructose transporter subunit IIC [Lachnospiraceae bacterium]|uniref:PTS fructose transporter subunit IIC n=1 Tax=Candidatus Weimeria bifida TaxID=2599074 RepID=A0A6N7J0T2_9FIRM|nr:PTS fructose transporter subunit IIC [Candidatus Weimeria bifida]RRF96777.1 MAG: PTS fructose transporter subunit IIC [Lachnospiraceae bacterium]
MKIRDLLSADSIELKGKATGKSDVLKQMVDLMVKQGNIKDRDAYEKGVFAREEESTTGIGDGIAIPHCKSDVVEKAGLAAMVLPDGVEFDSIDGQPVHLIFLIAAPNTEDNVHLEVLARLSEMLMGEGFVDSLEKAQSKEEFLSIIDKAESGKLEEEKKKAEAAKTETGYEVLAVTSCPNGVAHTYMAAQALEEAGDKLGIKVKVETRGSGGAKNVLTAEEIKNAKGIVVAADAKVPVDRFDGKPLIQTRVSDGFSRPEELLQKAVKGDAPVFHSAAGANTSSQDEGEKESVGHKIYTSLMAGVSAMLPFVIGGGILTAIAFLIDTILGFGTTGGSNFGSMVPLSALFKYVGGLAMGMMVPVLAGFIAYSIADKPGLAVGFLGGLLASNGNAVAENFAKIWPKNLGGFQNFIDKFAFQQSGNTVSGFLGGIAVGFLAGYIILWLERSTENLPKSVQGIRPMLIYPVVGMFLVMVIMCFVFNPIIGLINNALSVGLTALGKSGLVWLLGLVLAAMMAVDMGGPLNKAAYLVGTGMLATADQLIHQGSQISDPEVQICYIAMAAVMIGGMCPPVGIAIATKLFPKKFNKTEKEGFVSDLVMGASFITEAAIPFAASDPIHVIPSTFVGSAVAGLLSALFGCTLMAPHGGVFVIATIGRWPLFLLAWLIGSLVTAFMLGVLRKDVPAEDR